MAIMCKTNTSSALAAFATLKSLSDEKKYVSPYQILGEFIGHIIRADSLYSFSAVEMKNLLNEHFGFSIPEAVVKTSLKNIAGLSLANSIYTVAMDEIGVDSLFESKKREADAYSSGIIQSLSEYIQSKTGASIIEGVLTHELICFLIKDPLTTPTRYAELISEFILKNEKNVSIQQGLDEIREGSILYIGLSHNINETGSITNPLTLYLSTEILFSLAGYNGEIYQQFADDFFSQIRMANAGQLKKITLYYFEETKDEIDEFFKTAEEIVEGKRRRVLDKPAMKAIIDGCFSAADVTVKKADFYSKLKFSYGITEDPNDDYYDEIHFTSNLESADFDGEEDKKKKKEAALKFISHINKRRGGKRFSSDLDSGCLLVTNTRTTLLLSKEQTEIIAKEERIEHICGFAVSLDRITSLLWYKLGNGFSSKQFPSSVRAILKARVVLSSSIAKNADRVFTEIKEQFESGTVSEEYVASRILMLRNKPKLPEELQGEDIDEIMDFSPEYLSRYEEQFKINQNSLREKEELIETLKADTQKRISEKDATIASQEGIISAQEHENETLRSQLAGYQKRELAAQKKKERRKNIWRFVWSIAWKVLVLAALTAVAVFLESKYNSKIPMYISTVVNAVGLIYTLWCSFKKDKDKYLSEKDD